MTDQDYKKAGQAAMDFSTVLASSVHDMKNSLGMLLHSLGEVIETSSDACPDQSKHFATLQYEASRINGELVQLLNIYRMQIDRLPVLIDEHYVIDTLEEQVARNHMLFESRNLELQLDCDPDLAWYYDAELVGGVIHNVLINVARYSNAKLLLKVSEQTNGLEIAIHDDGRGYPEAMLKMPVQNKRAKSFKSYNTNLGLYFAGQVAALHKTDKAVGEITLDNGGELGGGVFKLLLP